MTYVGIDLHKRESQICVLSERGEVEQEVRIATTRGAFEKLLGKGKGKRVLVESSTESEWVASHLEKLGHEVVVADPNYAMMYAARSARVKTDKRDARALAEACRRRIYREAHRVSERQHLTRKILGMRRGMVESRNSVQSAVRAALRSEGLRLASGEAKSFAARVEELPMSPELKRILTPVLRFSKAADKEIAAMERQLQRATKGDANVQRLQTMVGVGPLIAAAFVARIDGAARFKGPHQVESYLGLVPSEHSSGEKQHRGHITKTGDRRMRALLVQAAWCIWRSRSSRVEHLRTWVQNLAARRGKRIAVVALARRIAGILFALHRDGTEYKPPQPAATAVAA